MAKDVGVSPNGGPRFITPKYHDAYYGDPQNGTLILGHRRVVLSHFGVVPEW